MKRSIRIHGTYPFDTWGKWKTVRHDLSLLEVSQLLNIEVTKEEIDKHDAEEKDHAYHSIYLWLNKGFVLLKKMPAEAGAGQDQLLVVACMELLGGSPSVNGIEVGDQAIYLHDGSYSLIERIEK